MQDLVIVIINYRTPKMAIDCLASLVPEATDMSWSIIMVENDSGDDSLLLIREWVAANDVSSQISIVDSKFNKGFSSGNNIVWIISKVNIICYLLVIR